MNHTDKIMRTAWRLWCCLGFYRGHAYYKTELKNDLERNKKTQYYYITNLGFCLAGTCVYAMPFTMPGTFLHELYNLEETIRGIKSDD